MMKKTITLSLFLLCSVLLLSAQTPQDSIAFAAAKWRTTALENGAECSYAQVELFGAMQSISVVRYPKRNFSTFIIPLDREAKTTSELGASEDADAAVNAGYFNVKTFQSTVFLRKDGKTLEPSTKPAELMRVNGMVAFRDKHGRKMDIFFCDTAQYKEVARRYRSAMACGPVLVSGGKQVDYNPQGGQTMWRSAVAKSEVAGDYTPSAFFTGTHPRSLIGKNDKYVFMVTIDGRFKGQGEGVTINQTAFIARMLGMTDALNLDGGGSATLWTAQQGVLNHPYDNKKFDHAGERAVPNCIAAKSRN